MLLGGVRIPHEQGLLAHSDGDVVLHALSDALLGALALGDIGHHFPPSDPAWADADSRELLRAVLQRVREQNYRPGNVDRSPRFSSCSTSPSAMVFVVSARISIMRMLSSVTINWKLRL